MLISWTSVKIISDLEVIGSLGSGAFGFVKLVKLKGCEGKAFALKCIQKHKVVQYGQQKHILDERNILRSGSNRIGLRTWPGQDLTVKLACRGQNRSLEPRKY